MFGLALLTSWFNALLGYLPNILTAIIIIFIGFVAGRLVGDLLNSSILKRGLGKGDYLGKLVQYAIFFVASVIAINQVGVDIQFLTTLVTIIIASLLFGAALAFGLGASTSVSNILGSYYLQKSYHEGNIVRIGEIEGSIVKITQTEVHIKTENGMVTIPAKSFSEEKSVLIKEN
jgi:small-conductance mechanosensitive channel